MKEEAIVKELIAFRGRVGYRRAGQADRIDAEEA